MWLCLYCHHPVTIRYHAPFIDILPLLDDIRNLQQQQMRHNMLLTKVVIASAMPTPSSTASQREGHQDKIKSEMRVHYDCCDASNPHVTRCLLLNKFFATNDVTYAHLVGVNEKKSLALLGMTNEDLWNPRNGILIHNSIETQFTRNNVVRFCIFIMSIFI